MILKQHTPQHDWTQLKTCFNGCTSWEQSYRQLLLLGKQLPAMPESLKTQPHEINGCESRVWLSLIDDELHIDSEARIVRGLIVILISLIAAESPNPLRFLEVKARLTAIGLAHHLSSSRSNGLEAIWRALGQSSLEDTHPITLR
jgi:cysteine desulfuration protein SufE